MKALCELCGRMFMDDGPRYAVRVSEFYRDKWALAHKQKPVIQREVCRECALKIADSLTEKIVSW